MFDSRVVWCIIVGMNVGMRECLSTVVRWRRISSQSVTVSCLQCWSQPSVWYDINMQDWCAASADVALAPVILTVERNSGTFSDFPNIAKYAAKVKVRMQDLRTVAACAQHNIKVIIFDTSNDWHQQ